MSVFECSLLFPADACESAAGTIAVLVLGVFMICGALLLVERFK